MENKQKFYEKGSFIITLLVVSFLFSSISPIICLLGSLTAYFLIKKYNKLEGFRTFLYLWIAFVTIGSIGLLLGTDESDIKDNMNQQQVENMNTDNKVEDKEETNNTISETTINETEFYEYAWKILGYTFIKDITLDKTNASILFYSNYEEYKNDNPEATISEEMYVNYFDTGNYIEKLMVGEPIRLLREFPALESVNMKLIFESIEYTININRDEANKYLGFKVENLSVDDSTWVDFFVNKYIYTKEYREDFFNTFVTVN